MEAETPRRQLQRARQMLMRANRGRIEELRAWWLDRMIRSPRPLEGEQRHRQRGRHGPDRRLCQLGCHRRAGEGNQSDGRHNRRRECREDVRTLHFAVDERTAVLDDDLKPVTPGSGEIGRLARRGRLPIGYYNDPEKTAATFVEVDGERWAMSGDFAHVEADGTIVLHGRGSLAINTGGEKVFPEEVEATLLSFPDVQDALVVGVPDERWGERVVAVVAPRNGASFSLEELQQHCRKELAGYKVPRELVLVDHVQRAPNGKADYRWAKEQALAAQSS